MDEIQTNTSVLKNFAISFHLRANSMQCQTKAKPINQKCVETYAFFNLCNNLYAIDKYA